ncbi:YbaB/EbfC family nucleoid-associated protein [Nocardia mexicana]|uniref:YbaB/EbfC DNA-binding family protein n=1 Tax=Nocardia mexicana TaxID=279262 RepID=A0A370GQ12_9NOCA|nr:YbaB/EbfC family nucleoid-associated protein [Nocardia mexicana]RDI45336.1 YbaB/EbfC DNA-binding family protein [Nocardia mexicana]
MDRWTRDGLRSANSGLRNQVENLTDAYLQAQPELTEAFRRMEALRSQADSSDHSVQATVDSDGVLTDLSLATSALRKTKDELARIIVEATQEAVRRARAERDALAASIATDLDDLPDLTDILGDASPLRDIRAHVQGSAGAADGPAPD